MKKLHQIKVVPLDVEHGVAHDTTSFAITTIDSHGKTFVIGGLSKKINGWHWHALGRAAIKQFDNFELCAQAAERALGRNIQFEERCIT